MDKTKIKKHEKYFGKKEIINKGIIDEIRKEIDRLKKSQC